MATVSERAQELARRIGPIYGGAEEIEQALLAERRLAMEEAANIADDAIKIYAMADSRNLAAACQAVANGIRAAVEAK